MPFCLMLWCGWSASGARAATIVPGSSTANWLAVAYPVTDPDPVDDHQTGILEADIIGDLATPALYWQFDAADPLDTTDGNIGFRVRVAKDKSPAGFDALFLVGLDADFDGDIDIFLGVDNRGNGDAIGLFDPGTGANTGPSNTSIVTPALQTFTETAVNYDWSPVSAANDPGAPTDFDMGGDNDYFLTFVVPFNAIVSELANAGIVLTDQTKLQFVAATSNQANALNQDLGGIEGGVGDPGTWAALGGFSQAIAAALGPVPEPGSGLLVASGLLALAVGRRRRR